MKKIHLALKNNKRLRVKDQSDFKYILTYFGTLNNVLR